MPCVIFIAFPRELVSHIVPCVTFMVGLLPRELVSHIVRCVTFMVFFRELLSHIVPCVTLSSMWTTRVSILPFQSTTKPFLSRRFEHEMETHKIFIQKTLVLSESKL